MRLEAPGESRARGQPHRRGRIGKKLAPRLVGSRDPVEKLAVRLRVGPYSAAVIAVRLDGSRPSHSGCDPAAALGGRRQREVRRGNSLHVDMQIDSVEERPRNASLVIGGATRGAAAGERRIWGDD